MPKILRVFTTLFFTLLSISPALAQDSPSKLVLISNVNIFDGVNDKLHENMHVLVKDNLIETVSDEPLAVIQTDNVTMIDGGGRTLMPGLIDSHVHLNATGVFQTFAGLQASKWDQIGAIALENARDYLYDGYTTATRRSETRGEWEVG